MKRERNITWNWKAELKSCLSLQKNSVLKLLKYLKKGFSCLLCFIQNGSASKYRVVSYRTQRFVSATAFCVPCLLLHLGLLRLFLDHQYLQKPPLSGPFSSSFNFFFENFFPSFIQILWLDMEFERFGLMGMFHFVTSFGF